MLVPSHILDYRRATGSQERQDLRAYVQAVVEQAPPFSSAQADRITALLSPALLSEAA